MNEAGWHRRLAGYAMRYKLRLLAGCGLVVGQALVVVALPWPMKLAVDYVLRERPLPSWAGWLGGAPGVDGPGATLAVLGAAVVVLAALNGGLNVARQVWRRALGLRMANDLAHDTLELVQRRSLLSISALRSGDLVQRVVADTRCIDTLVFRVWLTVVQSVVTFGLLAAVMLSMSGALAVAALGVAVPMLVVVRRYRDRMQTDAMEVADAQAAVLTGAEQMLATLPEVQSYGAEGAELRRFTGDADRQVGAAVRSQRTSAAFSVAVGSVTAIGSATVMVVGGLIAVGGSVTVGELLVFLSYLSALYGPVEGLAHLGQGLAQARAGALRVLALDDPGQEVPEPRHPRRLPPARRGAPIAFEGVSFAYRQDREVLADIDLAVGEGEVVAVVGRTGAGKSTLVSLIPRFFDPDSGCVRVDGVDVREVGLRSLRERVALVRQDPLLLPDSIGANIAYGSPEASEDAIRRAAHHALAAEFIERLPEGYDTVIGERGVTLSGGERQRLAIARALCRDAPILILDEPTASLDAESERKLLELVREAAGGRTIVMIAHRLSTVRSADRIVVLEGGRIVEHGSHRELVEAGGSYAGYLRAAAAHDTPTPAAVAAAAKAWS